jgi:putative redox protein
MSTVHAHIGKDHFKTEIKSEKNTLWADEPLSNGGEELGFSPSELLAASLSACTSITLRMYADRKGWPLEEVKVEVNFERDTTANTSKITRNIALIGNLDEGQRNRLLDIANLCPIHKTLSNPISIVSFLT